MGVFVVCLFVCTATVFVFVFVFVFVIFIFYIRFILTNSFLLLQLVDERLDSLVLVVYLIDRHRLDCRTPTFSLLLEFLHQLGFERSRLILLRSYGTQYRSVLKCSLRKTTKVTNYTHGAHELLRSSIDSIDR